MNRRCFYAAAIGLTWTALWLQGCGGGVVGRGDNAPNGGGGNNPPPSVQPNSTFRAAALAGYKAFSAGRAFPLTALQMTRPQGSAIPSPAFAAGRQTPVFQLDPRLGVYVAPGDVNGDGQTDLIYASDAGGANRVGALRFPVPGGPFANNAYPSYPVAIPIDLNLSGGNLPASGQGQLTYQGPTGANTLTGTFTLPSTGTELRLNLTLSTALDVGGSMTVVARGMTSTVSNLTGKLNETLRGNVTVAPFGWTGTADLNLLTGAYSIRVNTGNGLSTAAVTVAGNLNIGYASGAQETVTNPLTAPLVPPVDPGPDTSIYNAPVSLGAVNPMAINNNGQIAAVTLSGSDPRPLFYSSATAQPMSLSPFNGQYPYSLILGDSGVIAGFHADVNYPVVWTTPAATPQSLGGVGSRSQARGINGNGQIVGHGFIGGNLNRALFWSGPTATPTILPSLDSGGFGAAHDISDDGRIVGLSQASVTAVAPVYWASPTATPQALQGITGLTLDAEYVNESGQIAGIGIGTGGGATTAVFWATPTSAPVRLPALTAGNATTVNGLNDDGIVVGVETTQSGARAVRWNNRQVQDLNALIPTGTGWTLQRATSINDSGVIVGTGVRLVNGQQQQAGFVLTPKP